MDDEAVLSRINEIAAREHELRQSEAKRALTDEERAELRKAEIALDQCWDLLRQRRARREFHQDPGETAPRPVDTVEHYQQ
jgi:uncharacterized protein YajQ (UPF0234 family)